MRALQTFCLLALCAAIGWASTADAATPLRGPGVAPHEEHQPDGKAPHQRVPSLSAVTPDVQPLLEQAALTYELAPQRATQWFARRGKDPRVGGRLIQHGPVLQTEVLRVVRRIARELHGMQLKLRIDPPTDPAARRKLEERAHQLQSDLQVLAGGERVALR